MPDAHRTARDAGDYWAREFALYLREHRHPLNRLTHRVGIPILIVTAGIGIVTLDLGLLLAGQAIGWTLQLIGHRIEGNRPALLRRPISLLMGPLMVLVELAGTCGFEPEFAARARRYGESNAETDADGIKLM